MSEKPKTSAQLLMDHVKAVHDEVQETWPKWKRVIFFPRKPRNGFKT